MPQATVTTSAATLVAADPDNWRFIEIENLGPTNFIAIEIGEGVTATLAAGFQIPAGQQTPALRIPPRQIVSAIASTASCDVRYEVT
jgi:hypothetical protein